MRYQLSLRCSDDKRDRESRNPDRSGYQPYQGIGSHRIMRGNSVLHVFGNPSLPKTQEIKFRKELSEKVVHMLEKVPEEGEFSIIKEV